jgi:RNA polymerase sigma-70 factor (ECF subfamily)
VDAATYSVLVARYQRLAYSIAWQLLQNREEAEDVTQEAFVKVYSRLKAMPDLNFLPYLKATVANSCKDKLRRQQTAAKYQVMFVNPNEAEFPSPEDIVIELTQHRLLQKAIDSLPDMYRQVLILHYACEHSYEQIAELLNQPLSIVKNRIFRGKKLLRDAYLKIEGGTTGEMP